MIKITTHTKTVTKTTIEVSAASLKKNIVDSFKEIFNDYDLTSVSQRELYQADFNRLTNCLDQMDKGSYANVFKDGYTYMLLDPSDMEVVEKFFEERKQNTELEICITLSTPGTAFIVMDKDIQY